MPLIRINRQPSAAQLLVFSCAWAVVGTALACAAWHRDRLVAAIAWGAVGLIAPAAWLAFRPAARWLYLGLSYATYPIGIAVSHVVLCAVYYAILTPIGVVMGWFGHDPLARRFDPGASSYWIRRAPARPASDYFRQI